MSVYFTTYLMFVGNMLTKNNLTAAHIMCFVGANVGVYALIVGAILSSPAALGVATAGITISLISGIIILA